MSTTEQQAQAAADPPKQQKRAPKTFAQTLQDHHYGFTADECTTLMQAAISAAETSGKATEFGLKMKIKPAGKAGRYDITIEPYNKLPAKAAEAAVMFVGPDGNLTNKDPRQQDLPGIRVVDGPAPVRVEDQPQAGGIRVG